jgi:hypothetical protein
MQLFSLQEIFEGRIFRIPDYQRGYSWQRQQLEDLWEDIKRLESGRLHYTGAVTVERPRFAQCLGWARESPVFASENWDPEGASGRLRVGDGFLTPYYVVDGQQRLLTLSILLSEARNLAALPPPIQQDIEKRYVCRPMGPASCHVFGYEVDLPSHHYLIQRIYKNTATQEVETVYTRNLLEARNFFRSKLQNLQPDDAIRVIRRITQSLRFNWYEVDEQLDVFVVFETMNNRGRPLSTLELLKNRLLFLAAKLEQDGMEVRDTINREWKGVYEWLAKDPSKALDDDEFLRAHWIIYFPHDAGDDLKGFDKDLLYNRFTLRALQTGEIDGEMLRRYVASLAQSAKVWFQVKNPLNAHSALLPARAEWMTKIHRIQPNSFFLPIIMALFQANQPEADVLLALRMMERHDFLVFAVAKAPKQSNRNHFLRLAHALLTENMSASGMAEQIRARTGSFYNQTRFQAHITELFDTPPKNGYYQWDHLKYFLFEYETHLKGDRPGRTTWDSCAVERIFPKGFEAGAGWDAFLRYTEQRRSELANSLGNIVLLSRRREGQEQDYKSFQERKIHPRNNAPNEDAGYSVGSYSEMEVAESALWRHEEILARGIKLLAFLANRWDVSLGEDFRRKMTFVNFQIAGQEET